MKNIFKTLLIISIVSCFFSCARLQNSIAQDGGVFGSYNCNYIVINYSGGKIMDVWILQNTFVQSETNSDGWIFRTQNNTVIMIGGDAKVIRDEDGKESNKYVEYHYESYGSDYFTYAREILKKRNDFLFKSADGK